MRTLGRSSSSWLFVGAGKRSQTPLRPIAGSYIEPAVRTPGPVLSTPPTVRHLTRTRCRRIWSAAEKLCMASPDLFTGQRGPTAPASPNPASCRITCAPVIELAWGGNGGKSKLFIDAHSSLFRLQGFQDWDPSVAGIWDSQSKAFWSGRCSGVEFSPRMYETLSVVPSSPQTREGLLSLPKLK